MAGLMSADDRLGVIELIASYAWCVDKGDVEGYVDNFLPDGVVEYGNGNRCVGRDAVRRWVSGLLEIKQIGSESGLRHVLGLPQIQGGDDGRCSARTYVVIPRLYETGEIGIRLVISYIDDCVKVEGRWRFAKRVIRQDLVAAPQPVAESARDDDPRST